MSNLYYYERVLLKSKKKINYKQLQKNNQYFSQYLKERIMQREQKWYYECLT